MATITEDAATEGVEPRGNSLPMVVIASAAGTAFEWYDFFVFGTLASIIAKQFTGTSETAGFVFALGAFAAGFFVRPFGALFFGQMGDRKGRKGTFLFTIVLMGVATVAIGFLPTANQIGFAAPLLLVLTRVLQGFAMGGEYGGAAIYVAEHGPNNRRAFLTCWIQTTAAGGLMLALLVILLIRTITGEEAFQSWGWRIPFIASGGLLAVSLWIRMKLAESPTFQKMKAAGEVSRAPIAEAFKGPNLKLMAIALFSVLIGQGAIWYTGHFYAQFFLERVLKVGGPTVNTFLIITVLCAAAFYPLFGWLSDRIGRKPVMLFGLILAVVSYYPGFRLLTANANPALAHAAETAPVTVVADKHDCSVQFDPLGRRQYTSPCDIARSILSNAGIPFRNVAGPAGSMATIHVGSSVVTSRSLEGLDKAAAKTARGEVETQIKTAIVAAGYPAKADPDAINAPVVFGVLMVFLIAAAALYAPQAAAMVELFPTRVRYTAFSIPYNIGNGWVGGFLPVTAFAMVAATGNLYFGLWYPIGFGVVAIITTIFFLPETRGRSLD